LDHIIALYDGEIAWVDSYIGKLITELRRRGLYDDTIIVLTSDHGDEFFEHGEKGHQHSLYEELLHVPLIVRVPGLAGGTRYRERIELIDIMPSLLELTGAPAIEGMQGRSFLPLLRGEGWTDRPSFAETTKARKSRKEEQKSESWAVYAGDRKVILFEGERYPGELYDLGSDSEEQSNRFGAKDEERRELLSQLELWLERTPSPPDAGTGELDEGIRRQLEELGYIEPQ
jgi:arylsulfatase A-like enzyme